MSKMSTAGTAGYSENYYDIAVAPAVIRPVTVGNYPYAIDYVVVSQGTAFPPTEWSGALRRTLDAEPFRPKTELGKRLWEIRMRRIATGEPLMGPEEVEREIQERRGGQYNERP
jgi:hypothetical protein